MVDWFAESQGLIVRVLGTCNSSMDGVTYPCVLSIERIPFTESEVAGRLTKPEGYKLLEKVSAPIQAERKSDRRLIGSGDRYRSCQTTCT